MTATTYTLPGDAVSGKAGAGKSLFARHLIERLEARGVIAQRVSFASAVRAEVLELFGLREWQPSWRTAMRQHSLARTAEYGADYWLRQTARQLQELAATGVTPVIDDLRLKAEKLFLESIGVMCVRLEAPAYVRAARLRRQGHDDTVAFSKDPLECELDHAQFALKLINDAETALDDLRFPAERLCRQALLSPDGLRSQVVAPAARSPALTSQPRRTQSGRSTDRLQSGNQHQPPGG